MNRCWLARGGIRAPVSWEERKGPLLTVMQRRLLIDPVDANPLIKALSGRWHYTEDRLGNVIKDVPKKSHPWSDLGDAFVISSAV